MKKGTFLLLFIVLFSLHASAWEYNDMYFSVSSDSTASFRGCHWHPQNLIIPAYVSCGGKSYKVSSIGEDALYYGDGIVSIQIPNTVDSIYDKAFYGCKDLKNLVLPSSVKYVGYGAFYFGTTMEIYNDHCMVKLPRTFSGEYTIKDGITQIAGGAFEDCKNLTKINLPSSIQYIGKSVFSGCSVLDTLIIPDNIIYIGKWAIGSRHYLYIGANLNKFDDDFSNQVKHLYWNVKKCEDFSIVGDSKFHPYLDNLTIGDSVRKLPDYFCYEAQCKNISFKEGCEEIGKSAFFECDSLSSISFPASLKIIYETAFGNCKTITKVKFSNGIEEIRRNAFQNCTSIDSIVLPNTLKKIGSYAFSTCTNVTSLTLPANIESIDSVAFFQCTKLKSLHIPSSVKQLDYCAFFACYAVSEISCAAIEPPICQQMVFFGINRNIPLYVPAESIQEYKKADIWKEFLNIYPITTDIKNIYSTQCASKFMQDGKIYIQNQNNRFLLTGQSVRQ